MRDLRLGIALGEARNFQAQPRYRYLDACQISDSQYTITGEGQLNESDTVPWAQGETASAQADAAIGRLQVIFLPSLEWNSDGVSRFCLPCSKTVYQVLHDAWSLPSYALRTMLEEEAAVVSWQHPRQAKKPQRYSEPHALLRPVYGG